jgi:hypothetical protein
MRSMTQQGLHTFLPIYLILLKNPLAFEFESEEAIFC